MVTETTPTGIHLQLTEMQILVRADTANGITNVDAIQVSLAALNSLKDKALIEPSRYQVGAWVATGAGKTISETICPECFSPMGDGIALANRASGRVFAVDCRKCHACGFSENAGVKNSSNELPQPNRDFGLGEIAA